MQRGTLLTDGGAKSRPGGSLPSRSDDSQIIGAKTHVNVGEASASSSSAALKLGLTPTTDRCSLHSNHYRAGNERRSPCDTWTTTPSAKWPKGWTSRTPRRNRFLPEPATRSNEPMENGHDQSR